MKQSNSGGRTEQTLSCSFFQFILVVFQHSFFIFYLRLYLFISSLLIGLVTGEIIINCRLQSLRIFAKIFFKFGKLVLFLCFLFFQGTNRNLFHLFYYFIKYLSEMFDTVIKILFSGYRYIRQHTLPVNQHTPISSKCVLVFRNFITI